MNSPRGGDTGQPHKKTRRGIGNKTKQRLKTEEDTDHTWNSNVCSGYSSAWTNNAPEYINTSSSNASTSTNLERTDNDSDYQNNSTAFSKIWSSCHTSTPSSNATLSSEWCSSSSWNVQFGEWSPSQWNAPHEDSVDKNMDIEIIEECEYFSRAVDWPLVNDLDKTFAYYKADARLTRIESFIPSEAERTNYFMKVLKQTLANIPMNKDGIHPGSRIAYSRILVCLRLLCFGGTLDHLEAPSNNLSDSIISSGTTPPGHSALEYTTIAKEIASLAGRTLNPAQIHAIDNAMLYNLSLIQGPPGTGKTNVATDIASQWTKHRSNLKVLVTSDSNTAVDNLCTGGLRAKLLTKRSGNPESVRSDIHEHMLSSLRGERFAELQRNELICATALGSVKEDLGSIHFNRVIIDEAAQTTEAVSLVPLCRMCKQLVMIGDENQLPATVEDAAILVGSGISLFEKLLPSGIPVTLLTVQCIQILQVSHPNSITLVN